MRKRILLFGFLITIFSCKEIKQKEEQTANTPVENIDESKITAKFSIEILDESVKDILDPNATIKVLASGFAWTEGPLWVEDGNYLLFSDIPNNKVYQLDAKNDTTTYLSPSGFMGKDFTGEEPGSNGLLLSPDGELVLLQHGERRISKMNASLNNPTENYIPLIDNYKGKRLNSPNDAVYDTFGNLYFTDPPYGLPERLNDAVKELNFQGVYCLLTSGELLLQEEQLIYPNGIGISPDGKKLYVAVSNPEKAAWYAYDIVAPGKVENRTLLADATHLVGKENQQGLPDGLKVHSSGTIFATGPGGVWVFDPSGKVLARIYTGQKTANCTFDSNEKRLFMTADDYILSINLK